MWADNLAEEMAKIRKVVERYPYIGMVSHSRLSLVHHTALGHWSGVPHQ